MGPQRCAVTASTGCAAALIGATTLHSCMGLGLGDATAAELAKRNRQRGTRVSRLRTLIIDEVSMLDAECFEKASDVASLVRGFLPPNMRAWGGLQLIVCGDMLQLPAVKVRETGWVFETPAWAAMRFRNHVFERIHRQSGDPEFATVLSRVRLGLATAEDLAYLKANSAKEPMEGAVQLFARNEPASELNQRKLREVMGAHPALSTKPFRAIDSGPRQHLLEHCLAPKVLWLAPGCRVMCLRNLSETLVNGSTGTVTKVAEVRDLDVGRVVGADVHVRFDGALNGEPFEHVFSSIRATPGSAPVVPNGYEFSVTAHREKVATRLQLPLRHAWGISIHKAQGLSLSRANIDFAGVFEDGQVTRHSNSGLLFQQLTLLCAYGQAYTALSRMRSLGGAFLSNLTLRQLRMASDKVKAWYAGLKREAIA